MSRTLPLALLTLICGQAAHAWYGHEVTQGPLSIVIEEMPDVVALDTGVAVPVILTNSSDAPLTGTAKLTGLIDTTYAVGAETVEFDVPARGSIALEFSVAFGPGTYSALYPVAVAVSFTDGTDEWGTKAIRIVRTSFPETDPTYDAPGDIPVSEVSPGAFPLWSAKHRIGWAYYGQALHYKEIGWTGSDAVSRAAAIVGAQTRGETRPSLSMHPPWQPSGGTIVCDYAVALPDTTPLQLTFGNAIRDSGPTEPESDGVLFRVSAGPPDATTRDELAVLYENFTDAKLWDDGVVDLSAYAGQTILLRLESDPGPARNTTCDSSFWGAPTILAGPDPMPSPIDLDKADFANTSVGRLILAGASEPDDVYSFRLGADTVAIISPTKSGIIDGVITLVGRKSSVSFHGLQVAILDQQAIRPPTSLGFEGYEIREIDGATQHVHHLVMDGRPTDLTVSIVSDGDVLRLAILADERITDFSLGPASEVADSVYYGHGYRIDGPKAFRAYFGGHNLATSHVGFDFEGGMSILQAIDVPPDFLEVDPDSQRYALHAHMNGTLSLVASQEGAFDCATRYRPYYDKQPAPAVDRLAGRMCFDIWGGQYADVADRMQKMVRYGLTDTLLTMHVWQRWGYDYRLPDIWPPLPELGAVDDLRRLGEVCDAADIPWGLHDNYIDFYPDADGYSYEHIAFTPDGRPIPAWLNEGRDAQSYRWRPDAFRPFMERNLDLINEAVSPSHYFIDVFTSIGCIDFYDNNGGFHSSLEAREAWGKTFAYIRDLFGGDAPTTSEAGHDQLIGYLDGADCQFLGLSGEPGEFMNRVECADWERVPWFDAVNHTRFPLHGVGYSGRYEGGQGRLLHGINSDDYLSAEVLTGHSLMVDAGCWGRPAVRKYYLAQDIAANLAHAEIEGVQAADGDMHRQTVSWSNGTVVYVNRGEPDWTVGGHILPQYGYLVRGDGIESAIEERDGILCEWTAGPSGYFCDARTYNPDQPLAVAPRVEGFADAGDGSFSYDLAWQVDQPIPADARIFVHFYGDGGRSDGISFQDDHAPATPIGAWSGEVSHGRTMRVPADAAGKYEVGVGLWDGAQRISIQGTLPPSGGSQVAWVGTLTVTPQAGGQPKMTFTPAPTVEPPPVRGNTEGRPIDFDFALTDGAFRATVSEDMLTIIPLPDSGPFDLTIKLPAVGWTGPTPRSAERIDADGNASPCEFSADGDSVRLRHDGAAFAYRLTR